MATHSKPGSAKNLYFFINCSNCSSDLVSSISAYITNFDYFGDGVWNATFSIPFGTKTAAGTWYLNSMTVTDFAGNSDYVYQNELEALAGKTLEFTVE